MNINSIFIRRLSLSLIISVFGVQGAMAEEPAVPVEPDSEIVMYNDSSATVKDISIDLEEFVIVEHKKLVSSDGATLTYNVTEDPEAGSGSILEILKKVPGVTVDAEENVKVNGQSSFRILLNGREDPMLRGDIKTVLKSMPAASIKKIEVISEPGAKYDAEGVGGILNIVTDSSRRLAGFMSQLGVWGNPYNVGGYVNARGKIRNVMLDANVSYNNGNLWPRSSTSETTVESLDGSENHLLSTRSKQRNGWDYTGVHLGMTWEPDTLNLFTLSADFSNNNWNNSVEQTRDMKRPDMTLLWNMVQNSETKSEYNSLGMQLSFQHNFGRDDHSLILSYELDGGRQSMNTRYDSEYIEGTGLVTPFSLQDQSARSYYNIVQVDYANRFSRRHLLETGGKVFLNSNTNHTRPYEGESSSDYELLDPLQLKMKQFINVYALYASYTGSFSRWNIKGGLRYEYTYMGVRYRIGDYDDFTTRLNDLVPNAAISYNLSDASSLRFAYQMRISRPDISQINPYVNILRPGEVSYGNPDIKSQKAHTFSLSYSNYEGKFSGSAKLSYQYVRNGVNDVILMRDGVLNKTYANVGKYQMAMLDLSGDWNITQDLRWSVYLSGNYSYQKAESELLTAKNCGWQTNISTSVNYNLPHKINLSVNGGMWTPWRDIQGKGTTTGYYYGFGLAKSWLKEDALRVTLYGGNFLTPHRTNNYLQEDPSVRMRYYSRYSQWNVGINVSFSFGGLRAEMKRTAANIEKEGSSASGSKGGN